jgi:hypothetical protein
MSGHKDTGPKQGPELRETTRVRIRLKHSLPAGAEINTVLPDNLEEFDTAYANGQLRNLLASLDGLWPPPRRPQRR